MCNILKEESRIELTETELRTRINNLTKRFRKEKQKIGPTGGSPSNWEFYDILNEFLGCYKANNVKEMMDETFLYETEVDDARNSSVPHSSPSIQLSGTLLEAEASPPSETPVPPKKKKKNIAEKFFELAKQEEQKFDTYLKKCVENDEKIVNLLEENNRILSAFLNK